MIDTYKRLHREEQSLRRAMGEKPSAIGPMLGLAIGFGATLAGLLGASAVAVFFWVVLP